MWEENLKALKVSLTLFPLIPVYGCVLLQSLDGSACPVLRRQCSNTCRASCVGRCSYSCLCRAVPLYTPVRHSTSAVTHKAEEPITRLIGCPCPGEVECLHRVVHPGAVVPLLMKVMLGTSRQQFPQVGIPRNAAYCFSALCSCLDGKRNLNDHMDRLGDVGVGCQTVYILTGTHSPICLTIPRFTRVFASPGRRRRAETTEQRQQRRLISGLFKSAPSTAACVISSLNCACGAPMRGSCFGGNLIAASSSCALNVGVFMAWTTSSAAMRLRLCLLCAQGLEVCVDLGLQ